MEFSREEALHLDWLGTNWYHGTAKTHVDFIITKTTTCYGINISLTVLLINQSSRRRKSSARRRNTP